MSPAPDQPPKPEPKPERPPGRPTPRGRPRANRVFTNRDRPIAHFDRAHAKLAADEHRILGFYGVGGQGKTALRRHLMQRLGTAGDPGHRFGALDFHVESCREPARGLLALRRSLRESGALRCDTFDVAIARFWARAYPGEDVTRALGDLLGGLFDGVPDWLDLVEDLPAGLGLGVKVINRIRQRLEEEGAEAACATLCDLEHLEPDQIAEQLDLAIDTWLDLLAAGGRPPSPADFGATHPEVLARFLRHRTPAEREALKVLAGPAAFDREVFAALLTRFRIPYPLTAFEDLCDLSIIEPGADGCFRLHGLMRSHLLAAPPPAKIIVTDRPR